MNPEAMITKGGPRGIIAKSRWIGNVTDLIDVGGSTSWDSVIDLVMSALRAFYSDLNGHIDRLDISANAVIYKSGTGTAATRSSRWATRSRTALSH